MIDFEVSHTAMNVCDEQAKGNELTTKTAHKEQKANGWKDYKCHLVAERNALPIINLLNQVK